MIDRRQEGHFLLSDTIVVLALVMTHDPEAFSFDAAYLLPWRISTIRCLQAE